MTALVIGRAKNYTTRRRGTGVRAFAPQANAAQRSNPRAISHQLLPASLSVLIPHSFKKPAALAQATRPHLHHDRPVLRALALLISPRLTTETQ